MRSYQSHLSTLLSAEAKPERASTHRSSAIFPLVLSPGISARLLFLGYWMLKRQIDDIEMLVTLRSQQGEFLAEHREAISAPKAYEVRVDALIPLTDHFTGSVEIEFTSKNDLVFPFPAVVLNYYNKSFSTFVHSAQRVYNDEEDYKKNSITQVPESGFNIYNSDTAETFISIVNGPEISSEQVLMMQFHNSAGEVLQYERPLQRLPAYQHLLLWPVREAKAEAFLGQQAGSMKINFRLPWVYQRLIVGNRALSNGALSITHSYYDSSKSNEESDYWNVAEEGWHAASLMVPVYSRARKTCIYLYPIYSAAAFFIDIEYYSHKGDLVASQKEAITIDKTHPRQHCLKLAPPHDEAVCARLIARAKDTQVPTRIKIGLDVGGKLQGLPCNICTNLQPFNPKMESKPSCFRWAPLFADADLAEVWVTNSSPACDYRREATVTLTFYNTEGRTVTWTKTLAPHGHLRIRSDHHELKELFQGSVGWVTAVTSNPYINTYSFTLGRNGDVGGDHGF